MPVIPFGKFAPDQPSVNGQVMRLAQNCIFYAGAYRPLPGISEAALRAPVPNDLAGGVIVVCASYSFRSGRSVAFVVVEAGGAAKVLAVSEGSVTVLSKAGDASHALSPAARWNMLQYGERCVIASNANPLVVVDFADVITEYSQPDAVVGELIAVVRDRLWHAGDVGNPFRLRFTGIDSLSFDPADASNRGGEQVIPDTGEITALTGGEVGHIYTESGINRMTETGDAFIYQRDSISEQVGCRKGGWAVRVGGVDYFFANNGFKRRVGEDIESLGHGVVDEWIEEREYGARSHNRVFHWSEKNILVFHGEPSESTALAYNYNEDAFSTLSDDGVSWRSWTAHRQSAVSMNSPIFKEENRGQPYFVGSRFNEPWSAGVRGSDLRWGGGDEEFVEFVLDGGELRAHWVGYGAAYTDRGAEAVLETGEQYAFDLLRADVEGNPRAVVPRGRLVFVNEGRLIGDLSGAGVVVEMQVATRDGAFGEPFSWGPRVPIERPDFINMRARGRYLAWRVVLTGGWGYIAGVDVSIQDAGE